MIKDAHHALHDVQSSGRAKELLAQVCAQNITTSVSGLFQVIRSFQVICCFKFILLVQGLMQQRQYERTQEQEKIEKRRQVSIIFHYKFCNLA